MDVRMPDGTLVTGVPDDITQTELLRRFNKYQAPAPTQKERNYLEAVTDPLVALGAGAGKLAQFPGQLSRLAGISQETGPVEGFGKDVEKYFEAKKSEGLKAREAARAQKIQEAAEKGVLSEFGTAIGETITDPALLSTFLAEQIPNMILPAGAGRYAAKGVELGYAKLFADAAKAGVEKAATRTGVGAAVGVGALMQGTDIGSDAYKDAFDAYKKQGLSDQDAHQQALTIGRRAAFEAGATSVLAQRLPGGTTLEKALIGKAPKTGLFTGAVKGALGEAVPEMLEEGGGQAFANLEVSAADPTRQLMQGVGTAAGLGLVGGIGLGGIGGGLGGLGGKAGVAEPKSALDQLIEQTAPTGDLAARAREAEATRLADMATAAEMKQAGVTATPEEVRDVEVRELAQQFMDSGIPEEEALNKAKEVIAEQRAADKQNEEEAANVAARPVVTEPAPAGATGQPAAGEGVSESVPSAPPAGEGTVDARATGVGTAVEPAAGAVEGEGNERPALEERDKFLEATKNFLAASKKLNAAQKAFDKAEGALAYDDPKLILARKKLKAANDSYNAAQKEIIDIRKKELERPALEEGIRTPAQKAQVLVGMYDSGTSKILRERKFVTDLRDALRDLGITPGRRNKAPTAEYQAALVEQLRTKLGELGAEPIVEPPKEEPKTEAPKTEAPKTEAPKEKPKKAPKTEAPEAEDLDYLNDSVNTIKQAVAANNPASALDHIKYLVDMAEEITASTGESATKSKERRTAIKQLAKLNLPADVLDSARKDLQKIRSRTQTNKETQLKGKIQKLENELSAFDYQLKQAQDKQKAAKTLDEQADIGDDIADIEDAMENKNRVLNELRAELKDIAPEKQTRKKKPKDNYALTGDSKVGSIKLSRPVIDNLRQNNLKVAIAILANTGSNPIVRTYARKVLDVLDKTTVEILPTRLLGEEDAAGLYYPKSDRIIIDPQNLDEHTLLHEATHAALYHVVQDPKHPLTKELQAIYTALEPQIKDTYEGKYAAKSLQEFTAEFVGNEDFQDLLRAMPLGKPKGMIRSAWDRIVDAIRKAFGFVGRPKNQYDKIDKIISEILSVSPTVPRNVLPTEQEVLKVKQTIRDDAEHMKNAVPPKFGAGLNVGTSVWQDVAYAASEGLKARSVGPIAEVLKTAFNSSSKDAFTRALAYTTTPHHLKQMFGGEIRSISDAVDNIMMMDGAFQTMLKEGDKTLVPWTNLLATNPSGAKFLHEVLHASTIVEADASTQEGRNKNSVIAEAWTELGKINGAQKLYKDIIKFYDGRRDLTLSYLLNRVESSFGERPDFSEMTPVAAKNAKAAWEATKRRTMAGIRLQFEREGKIEPYVPLVRRGEYWIRIGKKTDPDYVFDMSETPYEQAKKLKAYKQMGVENIESGYGINQVMDTIQKGSTFIKEVIKLVDEADIKGDRAELMKDIYSAYLELLPEMSLRKHFLPRKGTAGYSPDAYRNFANFTYHSSRQLARMKYSTAALNAVDSAREAIKGMPNQNQLAIVIESLRNRIDNMLRPEDPNDPFARLVNGVTNISFYYYLSAPKSALNQLLSVPTIALPEMSAQFTKSSNTKITSELTRTIGSITKSGISWNNGAVTFPTYDRVVPKFENIFAEAEEIVRKAVKQHQKEELSIYDRDNMDLFKVLANLRDKVPDDQKNAFDLRRAYEQLEFMNAFDSTLSMDFMPGLRNTSDAIAKRKSGIGGKVLSFANQMSAGLFHSMEKVSRETTAMSSYKLARGEGDTHEEAIQKAWDISIRALGNYGKANAPGFMQHKGLKVIMQFKRFPIEMMFYMGKSAYDIIANYYALQFDKNLTPEERDTARAMAKAAKIRLTGMLGMVGTFAGVAGMPWLVSAAIEMAAMFGHLDDDDEDKLLRKNKDLWFHEWLKQTFNSKAIADIVTYGPASWATRADLHSSLSLNDLFFRDIAIKQSPQASSELQQYMIELLGPSAGMAMNVGKAWDYWNRGDYERTFEALAPAGIRNLAVARRYFSEGVKTPSGKQVFEKDEVNIGNIAAQMLGYTPQEIALQTRDNIARKGIEVEVEQERKHLIDLYDRAVMDEDFDKEDSIRDEIDKFNDKYPMNPITNQTLNQSVKRKMTDADIADRGLVVSKRYRPYLMDRD